MRRLTLIEIDAEVPHLWQRVHLDDTRFFIF